MKKSTKKFITKLALGVTVLSSLAMLTAPLGNSPQVARADETNPVSDTSTMRSITIWKYEIEKGSDLGERGDGSTAPDMTGKTVLPNINFRVRRVEAIGNASLTNPLVQVLGTDYTIDDTFTAMEGKTDAQGKYTFNLGTGKAADGIYLLEEISDDANRVTKPMDPVFIHVPQTNRTNTGNLIYDVNVYPKNIVTEAELDKTVEGEKAYSFKAGNTFTWEATTKLPAGLHNVNNTGDVIILKPNYNAHGEEIAAVEVPIGGDYYASMFKVYDKIDGRLEHIGTTVNFIPETGEATTLIEGTDYTLNVTPPVNEGDETLVVVSLTEVGMEKVEGGSLQVVYEVRANEDFNGTIGNTYGIKYLLPGQEPVGNDPEDPDDPTPPKESENNPKYYTGGFDIEKTKEDGSILAGAEFHIATSEANANAKTFLASDGNSYVMAADGSGTDMPDGVIFIKATSNENGLAEFNGLELAYLDAEGNPLDDSDVDQRLEIIKDYWVVETKAPEGFELLKSPEKVTVDLDTADDTLIELEVVNKAKTDLPFTGGNGMTLMIVIALGAIVIGTTVMVMEKKRRQA